MANVKISELTAATTLATTDQFEINAGGTSKSATAQKVLDLAASATQTLTNKTLDTPNIINGLQAGGDAGTTGSVLTSQGPGATPTWAASSGGAGSTLYLWSQLS